MDITTRLGHEGDLDAVRDLAAAAYELYVERIGRPPAPMTADYAAAIRAGELWVAEENLAYYPRHGYVETLRGVENGFRRVYFRKSLPRSTA